MWAEEHAFPGRQRAVSIGTLGCFSEKDGDKKPKVLRFKELETTKAKACAQRASIGFLRQGSNL